MSTAVSAEIHTALIAVGISVVVAVVITTVVILFAALVTDIVVVYVSVSTLGLRIFVSTALVGVERVAVLTNDEHYLLANLGNYNNEIRAFKIPVDSLLFAFHDNSVKNSSHSKECGVVVVEIAVNYGVRAVLVKVSCRISEFSRLLLGGSFNCKSYTVVSLHGEIFAGYLKIDYSVTIGISSQELVNVVVFIKLSHSKRGNIRVRQALLCGIRNSDQLLAKLVGYNYFDKVGIRSVGSINDVIKRADTAYEVVLNVLTVANGDLAILVDIRYSKLSLGEIMVGIYHALLDEKKVCKGYYSVVIEVTHHSFACYFDRRVGEGDGNVVDVNVYEVCVKKIYASAVFVIVVYSEVNGENFSVTHVVSAGISYVNYSVRSYVIGEDRIIHSVHKRGFKNALYVNEIRHTEAHLIGREGCIIRLKGHLIGGTVIKVAVRYVNNGRRRAYVKTLCGDVCILCHTRYGHGNEYHGREQEGYNKK